MRIIVFNMTNRGNIERVVCGDTVGTVVVKDTDSTRFAT
jgi:uridylate kinase